MEYEYLYIVELNYRDYVFDDVLSAAAFLRSAVNHCRDKNTAMNFGIRVEVKKDGEDDEESE